MTSYTATVHDSLSRLESDALVERIRSGSLTDEALQIATRILSERGVAVPAIEESATEVNASQAKRQAKRSDGQFISDCLQGTASLNDAFWTLGLGIWIVIGVPTALLQSTLGGIALLVALVFRDIAIWRCAPNAKRVFWGVAARAWVFLGYGIGLAWLLSR